MQRLFQAGMIAIPLKEQDDSLLNPEPNFLVIENIFNFLEDYFPDGQGGMAKVRCQNSYMKLLYREILPAEDGKMEEMRTVLMDDIGNISIPMKYVSIFESQETMMAAADTINAFLPFFTFRGILKGHVLEYDPAKSQAYLDFLKAEEEAKIAAAAAAEEASNPAPLPEEGEEDPEEVV